MAKIRSKTGQGGAFGVRLGEREGPVESPQKRPVLGPVIRATDNGESYRVWGRKMIQTAIGIVMLFIGLIIVKKLNISNALYETYAKYVTVLVVAFGTANVGVTIASILKNGGKKE